MLVPEMEDNCLQHLQQERLRMKGNILLDERIVELLNDSD